MPGQLKWVFVKRQVPRLGRIFLPKKNSIQRPGEERVTLTAFLVLVSSKRVQKTASLEVLGYG